MSFPLRELIPPAHSSRLKRFGLLPVVVSVVIGFGLVNLGPAGDFSWAGLGGGPGIGAAFVGTNVEGGGPPLGSSGDGAAQLAIAEELISSDHFPDHGLRRRLEHANETVGHYPDECSCTDSSANTGGLAFLEMIYIGPATPTMNYTESVINTMKVYKSGGNGKKGPLLLYSPDPADSHDGDGEWFTGVTNGVTYHYFRFEFPEHPAKKISQTAFHFCIGVDLAPDDVCSTKRSYPNLGEESTCDDSTILSGEGCYLWDVHTSCSTFLIGEEFWIEELPYFEIVRWGDRNAEPQRTCEYLLPFYNIVQLYPDASSNEHMTS